MKPRTGRGVGNGVNEQVLTPPESKGYSANLTKRTSLGNTKLGLTILCLKKEKGKEKGEGKEKEKATC